MEGEQLVPDRIQLVVDDPRLVLPVAESQLAIRIGFANPLSVAQVSRSTHAHLQSAHVATVLAPAFSQETTENH